MKLNTRTAWVYAATGLNATRTGGSFAIVALAIAHGRSIIEEALPAREKISINQMANNAHTQPFPRQLQLIAPISDSSLRQGQFCNHGIARAR